MSAAIAAERGPRARPRATSPPPPFSPNTRPAYSGGGRSAAIDTWLCRPAARGRHPGRVPSARTPRPRPGVGDRGAGGERTARVLAGYRRTAARGRRGRADLAAVLATCPATTSRPWLRVSGGRPRARPPPTGATGRRRRCGANRGPRPRRPTWASLPASSTRTTARCGSRSLRRPAAGCGGETQCGRRRALRRRAAFRGRSGCAVRAARQPPRTAAPVGAALESAPDAWAKAMASSENRLRDIRTSDPVASIRVHDVGPAQGAEPSRLAVAAVRGRFDGSRRVPGSAVPTAGT